MPALDGSDRTVAWARQLRYDLLASSLSTKVDDRSREALLSRARAIIDAGWWINHRNMEAARLLTRPNGPAAGRRTTGPV
jgi:hypothetical protein